MGRDDDHGGIGGQVADGAHESDHEGQDHRRDVLHLIGEQGTDKAGFLAHTDGQRHGEHQAQRCEAGEVLDHVGQEPDEAVLGEQVLCHNGLVLRGVDDGNTQQAEDAAQNGDDHEQIDEQDRRRGQLVTGTLQRRQEPVKPALLDGSFSFVLSHEIFLLKKLVWERFGGTASTHCVENGEPEPSLKIWSLQEIMQKRSIGK